MVKRFLLIFVAATTLTSCNSLNTYQLPPEVYRPVIKNPQITAILIPDIEDSSATTVTQGCPIYRRPLLPKMPEIPFKDLAKISPDDMVALDRLKDKHIEDLRRHVIEIKKLERDSYQKYLNDCGIPTKSK